MMKSGGRIPFEMQFPNQGVIQDGSDSEDVEVIEESEPINPSDPLLQIPPDESDLFRAVRHDDLDMISRLLRRGEDINSIHTGAACNLRSRRLANNAIRMTNYGVLHVAVLQSPLTTIDFLVKNGADVNVPDENHRTALHYSTELGRHDVTDYLVRQGADINKQSASLKTPLISAVSKGEPLGLKILINAGANLNLQDMKGTSALHVAAFQNLPSHSSLQILEMLINAGADVDIQNKKQATPLLMAINVKYTDAIKLLLDAGANVNHVDASRNAGIHFIAELSKVTDMVRLLIQRGADINCKDKTGDTPLKKAVKYRKMEAIRYLLLFDCYHDPDVLKSENIRSLRESYSFFDRFMQEEVNEPWSLLRCCRYAIRNSVDPSKFTEFENLLIPRTLKNYLQFK